MSTYCMSIYFILICLMLSLQQTSEAVDGFQCPTQSHWRHREAYCNSSVSYFCLYDRNNDNFTEICRTKTDRDFEQPGYKLVVSGSKQGTLDGDICEKNFYQPFPFNSSGNSRCVYQKSHCSEEGPVTYSNGTIEANRECRCDYTRGYDFLHRPKSQCFCVPSEEDCTCYLKICSFDDILSPDYECLRRNEWKAKFNCVPQKKNNGTEGTSTDISTEEDVNQDGAVDSSSLAALVVTLLILLCIAVVCAYICGLKQLHKQRDDLNGNENSSMAPKNVSDLQDHFEVSKWRKMNELFEVTHASKTVLNTVKTHEFVIISGPPGSGKSAIAYNTAFYLEKDTAFTILPVSSPDEIRRYLLPETKQIFLFDDPVGKYTVDDLFIQRWEHEKHFLKQTFTDWSNTKLILTCRSYIYKSGFCCKLQISPIHCDLLSCNLKLSINERRKICKKYNVPELNDDTIKMYDFLPSLCVGFSRQEYTTSCFVNPQKILTEEIYNTKDKSEIAFLAIALLVVHDNSIDKKLLSIDNVEIKLLNDLVNECGFKYFPSTVLLLSALYDLVGTYVEETKEKFACIHDTLFQNLSFIVGSSIIHCLIKYGSSKFLANRLQLASLQEEHDELVIIVKPEQEEIYFQRLMSDIKEGYHRHVFTGIQMKYSQFRYKLHTFLKSLKGEDITCNKNNSTPLHVVSEQGYDEFVFTLYHIKNYHINHQDNNKRTPLFVACLGGHDRVIITILGIDKSSLHIADSEDLMHLDAVSLNDYSSTVTLLLKQGANINRKDRILKRTAFQRACESGSTGVVSLLLTYKLDIKSTDINGLKAIHIACQRGHLNIVELLLNHEDMTNECDAHGRTPLFIACESNQEHIVGMLLENKADVNQTDVKKQSPIHMACQIGNDDIVVVLLDNFAKVNIKSDNGYSPLHVASMKGKLKCVKFLLDKHAEIDLATEQGWTAFFLSCSKGHLDICKLLKISGANINVCDKSANTPLHVACKKNHERIVKFLIEHYANVNAVNTEKESPLYIACAKESFDIVQLLINNHADVNICNQKGNSPLHVTCIKGNKTIVQLLLDQKANIHKRNKDGQTPFEIVHGKKNDTIADMFNRYKEK